ncbi:ABC transporter transmembrane domain-containing protein [Micromonospora sp. M12]
MAWPRLGDRADAAARPADRRGRSDHPGDGQGLRRPGAAPGGSGRVRRTGGGGGGGHRADLPGQPAPATPDRTRGDGARPRQRRRFFRHLLRLPPTFFDQRQAADLSQRVRGNEVVAEVLTRRTATTVVDTGLVLAYGALLCQYDLLLGLCAVVLAALNVSVLRYVASTRSTAVAGLQADRSKLVTTVYTTVQMIETVKAGGEEERAVARFAARHATVATRQQRLGCPPRCSRSCRRSSPRGPPRCCWSWAAGRSWRRR